MDNTTEQNKKSGLTKIISAIVVIAIAAFAWFKMKGDDATPIQTTDTPTSTTNTETQSPAATNKKYKDGSYTATGMYQSPAGSENVEISLTLKDDVITSATFVGKAVNPTSIKLQAMFKAGFNSYVVGKKVDDITVTAVNGSSLTPKGFMDALVKIKAQAQS